MKKRNWKKIIFMTLAAILFVLLITFTLGPKAATYAGTGLILVAVFAGRNKEE